MEKKPTSKVASTSLQARRRNLMAATRTRKQVEVASVTKSEIDRYWKMKRIVEEDHLLAAQKMVARIRAKNLKEKDYKQFEQSLMRILDSEGSEIEEELAKEQYKIGIKDWWTKSKYAYLNQPAIKCMVKPVSTKGPNSSYILRKCLHYYPAILQPYTTSFGVF